MTKQQWEEEETAVLATTAKVRAALARREWNPSGRRKEASRRRVVSRRKPERARRKRRFGFESASVGRLTNGRVGGRRFGPRPVPNPAPAGGPQKSRRSPRPGTLTTEACSGRPRRCTFPRQMRDGAQRKRTRDGNRGGALFDDKEEDDFSKLNLKIKIQSVQNFSADDSLRDIER